MGSRSTLLLRLAVLGAVLMLGAAVVAFRAAGPPRDLPAKSQLNGRTSQDYEIYGVQVNGAMGMVHVVWHGSCTKGRTLNWVIDNVDAARVPFTREGRGFSVLYRRTGYTLRGSTPHETLRLTGAVAADRRSAVGTARGRIAWTKGGQPDGSCDSGPVSWKLTAPPA